MGYKQKHWPLRRRRFFCRVLAGAMFFYLCADVSVLEYFCGNPSLGIASFRQFVEVTPRPAVSRAAFAVNTTRDPKSEENPDTDFPIDGDDCFCCSSHATVSYTCQVVSLVPADYEQPGEVVFPDQEDYANWYNPQFFRPPRLA